MGKFLTCKTLNKQAAKHTMRRAWGLEDNLRITEVGPNLFQFKFRSEFDMNRIFEEDPGHLIINYLCFSGGRKG